MAGRSDARTKGGTKLATVRMMRGMSQSDLAQAVGISLATYRRLERGLMDNPPLRYIANAAFVLQVGPGQLIEPGWLEWQALHERHSRPDDPQALWNIGPAVPDDALAPKRGPN